MRLGIFTRTFARPTVEEVFAAVAAHGLTSVQFSMSSAGLPAVPDRIDPALAARIRAAADAHGIAIHALSGTFNMIHPEVAIRLQGVAHLTVLATACATLGARLITLCTGTRDPEQMWRRHPDNDTEEAWSDLLTTMREAVEIAGEHDLRLGIEPEPGNVVSTPARARRLLDEIGSPRLGIVLDPANLIEGVPPDRIAAAIDQAFALLGDRIVSAHGKDRDAAGAVVPAGRGIVPWPRFLGGLESAGYAGPLIIHGLEEAEVADAVAFLRSVSPERAPG